MFASLVAFSQFAFPVVSCLHMLFTLGSNWIGLSSIFDEIRKIATVHSILFTWIRGFFFIPSLASFFFFSFPYGVFSFPFFWFIPAFVCLIFPSSCLCSRCPFFPDYLFFPVPVVRCVREFLKARTQGLPGFSLSAAMDVGQRPSRPSDKGHLKAGMSDWEACHIFIKQVIQGHNIAV